MRQGLELRSCDKRDCPEQRRSQEKRVVQRKKNAIRMSVKVGTIQRGVGLGIGSVVGVTSDAKKVNMKRIQGW